MDADAPAGSGLYGYESLPKLFNTTYVANSNDSYWLSNPDTPLTGFPSVMGFLGHEGKQQNLRTQVNHAMVAARLAGSDGFDAISVHPVGANEPCIVGRLGAVGFKRISR